MEAFSHLFLFVLLGIEYLSRNALAQRYVSYPDLENTCNQTMVMMSLGCPGTFSGTAGTFRYFDIWKLSEGMCYFNVFMDPSCGMSSAKFAFYFNIRKLRLPAGDHLAIYETRDGSRILIQQLTGYMTQFHNPSTVAQALTSYAQQPSFTFEYFRNSSLAHGLDEVYIDFVVVEDTSHHRNIWCKALHGYVSDEYFCDKDEENDRVNCPDSFAASVNGYNPALWWQCERQRAVAPSHHGLNSGDINGIVIGIAILLLVLIAIAVTPPARLLQLQTSTEKTSAEICNISRSVDKDEHEPLISAPALTRAPPSYAEVTASPPQDTFTMPQTAVPQIPKY